MKIKEFSCTNNYMKNGTIIRQVVNKLNEIDFNASEDRHTFGDIYESLLRDLQSAGNYGEFYTPRAVTEIMTEIVKPRLGEKVLDPACGTGGFLTSAIENIRKADVRSVEDLQTLEETIRGVETNYPAQFRTTESADLFLLLMIRYLKVGGRAAYAMFCGGSSMQQALEYAEMIYI